MSKEHAYAYEAGYRDGSINYELEHCPACKNVADLQEALAENAKLRKMNEAMWLIIRCAIGEISARDGLPVIHEDDLIMLRNMRRELGMEVSDA